MPSLIQPFRQGSFDGLCGIYAIINAVRLLCPEVDRNVARLLFETLIEALTEANIDLTDAVLRGTDHDALRTLVEAARAFVRWELGVHVSAHVLAVKPHDLRTLDLVWVTLQAEIDGGCVAILGLEGRHSHWTVGHHMTKMAIRLVDSDGLHVLLRSRCSVNRRKALHRLTPGEIVLLSRVEW